VAYFTAGLALDMRHLDMSLIAEVGGSWAVLNSSTAIWGYTSGTGSDAVTYTPMNFSGSDITEDSGNITDLTYTDLWTTETPGNVWFALNLTRFSLKSFLKMSESASATDDHAFLSTILKSNDQIFGSKGNDALDGFKGSDTLTGDDGKDQFVFDTAPSVKNVDTVQDFAHSDDTIDIDHSVFKDMKAGKLAKADFTVIAGAKSTAGVDASDRILYDDKHGDLYFDRDGSHTKYDRVLFAHVADGTVIDNTDFHIV
jgi:Ca2+-binding RTX toxin-like protein